VRDTRDKGEPIPEERWRLVVHQHFRDGLYPTQYFCVSNHGRIVSNRGLIKDSETCYVTDDGYPHQVSLGTYTVSVHEIVCRTFNGPKPRLELTVGGQRSAVKQPRHQLIC